MSPLNLIAPNSEMRASTFFSRSSTVGVCVGCGAESARMAVAAGMTFATIHSAGQQPNGFLLLSDRLLHLIETLVLSLQHLFQRGQLLFNSLRLLFAVGCL